MTNAARMPVRDRYRDDPHFRQLVDVMVAHIVACDYSPTEMREAAVLACIRCEEMRPRSTYLITDKELIERLLGDGKT